MKRPSMWVLCYRHLTNIAAAICETKSFLQLLRVRSNGLRERERDIAWKSVVCVLTKMSITTISTALVISEMKHKYTAMVEWHWQLKPKYSEQNLPRSHVGSFQPKTSAVGGRRKTGLLDSELTVKLSKFWTFIGFLGEGIGIWGNYFVNWTV